MGTKTFNLPDLGEGLTEGEVVSWLVEVGDVVEVDQQVAEIETAKAVVEVPSPFAGTVVTLHGQPGEEVMVGAPLITIDIGAGEGDPAPAGDQPAASGAPSAAEDEASCNVLVGYGTSAGGGSRRRRGGAGPDGDQAADGQAEPVQRDGRPLAKPPVRKMAKDLGIDLADVPGTGRDGIITRDDVRAFADAADEQPAAPADSPTRAPASEAQPLAVAIPQAAEGAPSQTRVPMSQIRRAISAQMSRSRREIPEAVTWVEADATPLWQLRSQINARQAEQPDGVKVSALAIIMRMVVAGLRRFPTVNASLDTTTDEMVLHRHVNLGFAAQTDRGLVVPVIRDAQDKSIVELARDLNAMAARARAGKLSPADMAGGTFTVSNYGAFGVDGGDMVINHPEAAILGTGRIVDKPWVVDGELAVRKVITYAIAFDHRLIDGGEGAGFVRHLADLTEDPTALLSSL